MRRLQDHWTGYGHYSYKNPFDAGYVFVEGMGFVPSDPNRYEKNKIQYLGNMLGLAFVLYFLTSLFLAPFVARAVVLLAGFPNAYINDLSLQIYQFTAYVVSMTVPFVCYKLLIRIPTRVAFHFKRPHMQTLACGFGSVLALSVVGSFTASVLVQVLSNFRLHPYAPDSSPSGGVAPYALFFLTTCVAAPFLEEAVFRGVILQSMRMYGDTFALLLSSLFFGLVHLNLIQAPNAFIIGLALGYFVLKTGSLWTGVLLHAAVNTASFCFGLLQRWVPDETFQLVGYLAYGVFLLCGVVSVIVYDRSHSDAFLLRPARTFLNNRQKSLCFLTAPLMILALCAVGFFSVWFL